MKNLLLVDEQDTVLGYEEKMTVHQQGLLHRAFSIVIVNSKGEILLHQRAVEKYHSGGLWTNACCSHPLRGEPIEKTLQRKLQQEMGFQCPLQECYSFIYHAAFSNGLIEHELDYVYFGTYDGPVYPNAAEVQAYKWVSKDRLLIDVEGNPECYTQWFKLILAGAKAFNSRLSECLFT